MREFVVFGANQTLTNNNPTTAIFINPAAAPNINLEFLRWWIGQHANATSVQLRIQLATQASAFPTLTSATPKSLKLADPNASVIVGNTNGAAGTAGITASAEGAGAKTSWGIEDAFNALNGYLHVPTPRETRVIPAGFTQGASLNFPTAPSTLTNWDYGCVFAEV